MAEVVHGSTRRTGSLNWLQMLFTNLPKQASQMRFFILVLFLLTFLRISALAQPSSVPLIFKTKVGFTDPNEKIIAQKFIDNDRSLLLVGKKGVQVWDVERAALIESRSHEIPNLEKTDTTVKISPDGNTAIVLDSFSWRLIRREKKVFATVWDLNTGKQIAVLERPTESVRYAEWSKNGETLITFSGIRNTKRTEIAFWDGRSFKLRNAALVEGGLGMHHLSRNGETLITSAKENTTRLQNVLKAEQNTRIWDATAGESRHYIAFDNGESPYIWLSSGAVSPDEKYIAASGKDGKLGVWEFRSNDFPKYVLHPIKKGGYVVFRGFSTDGRYIVATQNRTLEVYEAATGKLVVSLPGAIRKGRSSWSFYSVEVLGDAKILIVNYCGKLDAFNLPEQRKLYELDLVCKERFSLGVSDLLDSDVLRVHPNENLLLTFSDKTIRIWNARSGGLLQTLADPERAENKKKDPNKDDGLTRSAGWIGNGRYLFAGGADGRSIFFWELNGN